MLPLDRMPCWLGSLLALGCLGCAPAALPPLGQAPIVILDSAKCYGFNTNYRYIADRSSSKSGHFKFAFSFDFGISSSVIDHDTAYARVLFDVHSSVLRILFLSQNGEVLHRTVYENSKILECEPDRTVVVLSYGFGSGEGGYANRRVIVTFSKRDAMTRLDTKVEGEGVSLLILRNSEPTRQMWAEYEPYLSSK